MKIQQLLKKHSIIEIDILLPHVLGTSKEFLYINPGFILSARQLIKLSGMVQRRLKGEPIAYIVGFKDFCGLRFEVNKNVLIPRPETEWIVERIIKHTVGLKKKPVKILDIGTGSGAIIVSAGSLGKTKNWELHGADISLKALGVAKRNAKKYKTAVTLHHSDLFKDIPGTFDIVIANLPYVPSDDLKLRFKENKELTYEPKNALTDGTNTFQIYEQFMKEVGGKINPQSLILLEIDPKTKPYLQKWAKKYLPTADITFYKDFNNLRRFAEIKSK